MSEQRKIPAEAKPESRTRKIIRWVIGGILVAGLVGIFVAMILNR